MGDESASQGPDPLLATDLHVIATYRLTEALVAAENRMRRRVEMLAEAVFETDKDGCLVFLNGAWGKMLGYALDKCLRRPLADFVVNEDRAAFESVMKGLPGGQSVGRPRIRFNRASGDVAWLEISAALLPDGGVVGALHDVTGEKRAQEEVAKLSLVASYTDNLVIITDAEGRIEWVNQAFTRRTGYTMEEVAGRRPDEVLRGPETDPATIAQINAWRAEGLSFKAELFNYTKWGEPYWASFHASPIRDALGRLERFVSIQTDSSELRRTQRELEIAKERAEAANHAKTQFLANMSHEIRTPMNGIIGMNRLLLDTPLNQEQKDFAVIACKSAESLLTIINDILDFSKIEADKLEIENLDFDLRECLEGAIDVIAESAHAKGLEVAFDLPAHSPTLLRGDPGRLRQIVLNLLGNAVKFTEQGEVVLESECVEVSGDTVDLRIKVRDSGIGIPEDRRQRLFQAFSQADNSTARRYGGTGLGVVICRGLIGLMGGSIDVSSEHGKGSEFSFHILLERQPVQAALSVGGQNAPDWRGRLEGAGALIIDPHGVSRRILTGWLSGWGMNVWSSEPNAESALASVAEQAARGRKCDVVFMSCQPKGSEPSALAAELRAHPSLAGAKWIMMSSMARRLELAGRGDNQESEGWLIKPVKLGQLRRRLENLMAPPRKAEAGASSRPQSPRDPAKPGRRAILLAEDNHVNQIVTLNYLRRLGYEADCAADGLDVIQAMDRKRYDLILMDCQMPRMDGYEATRRIRAAEHGGERIWIVAMTANAMQGDRETCLASGMDDYLSKPVRLESLKNCLAQYLEV